MTYLAFHLTFLLPPLAALALLRARPADVPARRAALVGAGLAVVACLYTLPWDAYLIRRGVWSYGPGRVLATVVGVPVEEIAFFVLQTALATLWTLAVMRWAGATGVLPSRGGRAAQAAGAVAGLALTAAGGVLMLRPPTLYLGLILAWAGPPLAVQWGWGLDRLLGRPRVWLAAVAGPAAYLGLADALAIRDGVWTINAATSTGWTVRGMPVEELLFFVVTSALVAQGVLLALDVFARRDAAARPDAGMRPDAATLLPEALPPTARVPEAAGAAWFAGPPAAADLRRGVARSVLWPSRIALAALVPLGPLTFSWPVAVLVAPFAASLVLFGLPHGAVDPFVLRRTWGGRLGVAAAYLGVVVAVLAVWAWAPVASALGFLVLTALHWGLGDLHTLVAFDGARHLRTRAQRAATVAVRGGLPMLVPLVASPEPYRRVVGWMAGALDGGAEAARLGAAEALFAPGARLALGAAFACLAVATLAVGRRRAGAAGRAAWRVDAAETAGLAAFFAAVEPLLAVGLYFCLWHAPRHIARLVAWSPPAVARAAQGRRVWPGFAVRALPGTAGALALLGALWVGLGPAPTVGAAVGVYLALIAAMTVPHALVVAWMDRAEGLWSPRGYVPASIPPGPARPGPGSTKTGVAGSRMSVPAPNGVRL